MLLVAPVEGSMDHTEVTCWEARERAHLWVIPLVCEGLEVTLWVFWQGTEEVRFWQCSSVTGILVLCVVHGLSTNCPRGLSGHNQTDQWMNWAPSSMVLPKREGSYDG